MLQQIINMLYRYPKARLKTFRRFGGYLNYRQMLHSREQMKQAALNLPPVTSTEGGLPVYFLTGKNFLYQTLFCIQSLTQVTSTKFQYILVDDGSFTPDIIAQINRQLPGAIIVTQDMIENNLQNTLPYNQYPNLNQKRKVYPHIKKLTDVHCLPGDPWKLVLDSDMLFWAEPKEIIDWLKNPTKPIHMVDCNEAYGYSRKLMTELTGTLIPDLLNVGVIGLSNEFINWPKLESWVKTLEQQEGGSYYLEQALTAMLVGETESIVLDSNKYKVNPTLSNSADRILHHYVDLSKKEYYNIAWKQV